MVRTSIVIPTWKHGKHVEECVGSLLFGQTMRDFEIVMVLDGMDCQDPQTLKFLSDNCNHPQLHVIPVENNQGQAATINLGMSFALGTDFLTWAHNDNKYAPQWLERMVEFLDEHADIDFVWSWLTKLRGDHVGAKWKTHSEQTLKEQSQSFFFRRKLWEKVGIQRGDYAHDTDWFLRAQEAGKFGELPEVLMERRIHPGGVSQTQRDRDDSARWIAEAKQRRGGKL